MIRAAAALALLALMPAQDDALVVQQVVPSQADSAVKAFDEPSLAIAPPGLAQDAPLAIFLSGTGGRPAFTEPLLRVIAGQGYRVIGLSYNNVPAVVQMCTDDPDPGCAGDFREMRVAGTGGSRTVSNPVAEAIVPRLVAALRHLARTDPANGWGRYLDGDAPRWGNILVSGLSQGAGMAAWIAKRHKLRRVVLFSSPWETTGADGRPAPWISEPSATPIARWQASYNAREKTVPLIQAAYASLGLGEAQIHVMRLDLPEGAPANGPNPYHPIGVRDPRYADLWRTMYGKGSDLPD